ncbi:hypothetical protein MVEN_00038900 [Mycena venus]|uniref:DUF6589 domain-containing protein n=1 Tax=Mycena venus TaxID=2733690 RepID=A0A8H6Z6M0_9AGAR|nr:hypothetical protein MVEN_00038900 [Mycena venus]
MDELATLYKEADEFLWYFTECCAALRKKGKVVVKKTRPHPVIQVGAISSFITSQNQYASRDLGLPLGIWLFTCQAHVDVKRVFCRFGYSASDSTVRAALNTLTDASPNELKKKIRAAIDRDNIQRYDRVHEHGLGKENTMKHGIACTAFHFDDCKPGTWKADDHIASITKGECQTMTAESVFNSIDWTHMNDVTDLHFVRVAESTPPRLHHLKAQISERFRTTLAKHRLPPHKKELQPLSTRGDREIENKGYHNSLLNSRARWELNPKNATTYYPGVVETALHTEPQSVFKRFKYTRDMAYKIHETQLLRVQSLWAPLAILILNPTHLPRQFPRRMPTVNLTHRSFAFLHRMIPPCRPLHSTPRRHPSPVGRHRRAPLAAHFSQPFSQGHRV